MTVTVKSKTPLTVPPSVRRRIDARLAESEADLKHGRTHGPFATHEDMMAFLKDDLAKQRRPAAEGSEGTRQT